MLFDPHNEPRSASATPLPPVARTPTPRPSQSPWQPGVNDPFDIYLDGVDNVPDSATIVKVSVFETIQKFVILYSRLSLLGFKTISFCPKIKMAIRNYKTDSNLPGSWLGNFTFMQVNPAQYSLTVQNHILKLHSFLSYCRNTVIFLTFCTY